MPKGVIKPNAFMLFMQDVSAYYQRNKNIRFYGFGDERLKAICDNLWMDATDDHKEFYKSSAKNLKSSSGDQDGLSRAHRDLIVRSLIESVPPSDLTMRAPVKRNRPPPKPVFPRVSEFDLPGKRKDDRSHFPCYWVWHMSHSDRTLAKETFYCMSVESYYYGPEGDGRFIPAEISLIKFNLADGVLEENTVYVSSDGIPQEMEQHVNDRAIMRHGLSFAVNGAEYPRLSFCKEALLEILGFLGLGFQNPPEDPGGQPCKEKGVDYQDDPVPSDDTDEALRTHLRSISGKIPDIFCSRSAFAEVAYSMAWLKHKSDLKELETLDLFSREKLHCIEDLAHSILNYYQRGNESYKFIDQFFDAPTLLDHNLKITCSFHHSRQTPYCALAAARRNVYIMYKRVVEAVGLSQEPGRHFLATLEPTDFEQLEDPGAPSETSSFRCPTPAMSSLTLNQDFEDQNWDATQQAHMMNQGVGVPDLIAHESRLAQLDPNAPALPSDQHVSEYLNSMAISSSAQQGYEGWTGTRGGTRVVESGLPLLPETSCGASPGPIASCGPSEASRGQAAAWWAQEEAELSAAMSRANASHFTCANEIAPSSQPQRQQPMQSIAPSHHIPKFRPKTISKAALWNKEKEEEHRARLEREKIVGTGIGRGRKL